MTLVTEWRPIFTAGLAGLAAGTVSVPNQRDTEPTALAKEKRYSATTAC